MNTLTLGNTLLSRRRGLSLPDISSFTFSATPTDPKDGEDVVFTVPDDGNGNIYTVEIIDLGTGLVFTTLNWTGSEYKNTVTFNGTDGDSWDFEAKKTRDQDGATKRSGNTVTVTIDNAIYASTVYYASTL